MENSQTCGRFSMMMMMMMMTVVIVVVVVVLVIFSGILFLDSAGVCVNI